jgi:hypothetical protein
MLPLDDPTLHELLLVYVARGRRGLAQEKSSSVNSTQHLTSLALSDAVSRLVPCRQDDSSQRTGARLCMIKAPRGLWEQDNELVKQATSSCSEAIQRFREADAVFVEVSLPWFTLRAESVGLTSPTVRNIVC